MGEEPAHADQMLQDQYDTHFRPETSRDFRVRTQSLGSDPKDEWGWTCIRFRSHENLNDSVRQIMFCQERLLVLYGEKLARCFGWSNKSRAREFKTAGAIPPQLRRTIQARQCQYRPSLIPVDISAVALRVQRQTPPLLITDHPCKIAEVSLGLIHTYAATPRTINVANRQYVALTRPTMIQIVGTAGSATVAANAAPNNVSTNKLSENHENSRECPLFTNDLQNVGLNRRKVRPLREFDMLFYILRAERRPQYEASESVF